MTKTCTICSETKPLEEFHRAKFGSYGRKSVCAECCNKRDKEYRNKNHEAIRRKYQDSYKRRPKNKVTQARWYKSNPAARKAHSAIRNEVRAKRIPRASTLPCANCHNTAAQYHHHLGYEPEHWLDVIPLCCSCHQSTMQRS